MIVIILLIVLLAILLFELYLTTKINRQVNNELKEVEESVALQMADIQKRCTVLEREIISLKGEKKNE